MRSFASAWLVVFASVAVASLWLATPLLVQSQGTLVVRDSTSCQCRVYASKALTVGLSDASLDFDQSTRLARNSRGEFAAAPSADPGTLVLVDAKGRTLRRFGRLGEGPGEFRPGPKILFFDRYDSLFVFDRERLTVFAPLTQQLARTVAFEIQPWYATLSAEGRLVVQYPLLVNNGVTQLVHELGPDGRIRRSFGGEPRVLESDDLYARVRAIASARDEGIWVAHQNRLRVEKWGSDGAMRLALERRPSWFSPWSEYVRGEPISARPRPRVMHVGEDDAGRVWISINVADSNWKPAVQLGILEQAPSSAIDWSRLWDSVVEVWDPKGGTLLSSIRFEDEVVGFSLASGVLYTRRMSAGGFSAVDVWTVKLFTTPPRRTP